MRSHARITRLILSKPRPQPGHLTANNLHPHTHNIYCRRTAIRTIPEREQCRSVEILKIKHDCLSVFIHWRSYKIPPSANNSLHVGPLTTNSVKAYGRPPSSCAITLINRKTLYRLARLCIVRCYSFDSSVVSIGAVGGRRWVGLDRVVSRLVRGKKSSEVKYKVRSTIVVRP